VKRRYALSWALAALLSPSSSLAYPAFIGYGYTSCQVCHFNAFGNGPLTDYGRALGANTIAAKTFQNHLSDEEVALASGFLGKTSLPDWIRPAVDFRGLLLYSELQSDEKKRRFIPMQLDAALTLISPNRKHWISATLGYLPLRKNLGGGDELNDRPPLISREHYVSVEVNDQTRVMAGMMDIPFGLRIPDHTAFSRSSTQLAQNDQAHLLLLHRFGETYELGLSAIAGNLFQDGDLQQRGGALLVEYDLYEKIRVGHSTLYTSNDFRSRFMNAAHARIGTGQGSAVLFELGFVSQKTELPSSNLRSYFLIENMIRFSRGVHILLIGEYSTNDTFKSASRSLRVGPALQYFITNRLEWRSDLQVTRPLNGSTVEKDSVDLLSQVHLWF
jgi:hypothetical protein